MSAERVYRCSGCFDHRVDHGFDTSHLSTNCPVRDSFERFINDDVVARFLAFEESPPDGVDWERLDRRERLLLSERVVRTDRSVEDFEVSE